MLRIGYLAVAAAFLAANADALTADAVRLTVTGGDTALAARREDASLVRQAVADPSNSTRDIFAAARAEYRQLLGALYDQGYFGPQISVRVDGREVADIPPLDVPAAIGSIAIAVDPGPAFRFSRATVAPVAPGTALPEAFAPGARARVPAIQAAARAGIAGWRAQGHAKAALTREEITADHADSRLAVDIGIAPGPRLRFGPLVIRGAKRMREERVRAIAGLPVGTIYDPEALERSAQRLRRTGAFSAVSLRDAEQVGPGDQLAIEADLVEERRRRLGAGIELSSLDGLRLSAYWLHRNLLGGAERLRFDAEIANLGTTAEDNGVDYRLGVTFRRPATFSPDTDLELFARVERELEPGHTSNRLDIGGDLTWYLSDELELSAGVLVTAAQTQDAFGKRDYYRFGLPVSVTWDRRDVALDAKSGFYLAAEAMPFIGLEGISNGVLLTTDARVYRSLGERLVLAGRLQTGNLIGPDIDEAPPTDLFYGGGGGSVRGQPYQSLGAGERNGTLFGGRSYLALSAEARLAVRGPIGMVGFYDRAYVGPEETFDGSGRWIDGAGLGLRYATGFGPVRVDIATPLSGEPEDANRVQLYIGIGQAF